MKKRNNESSELYNGAELPLIPPERPKESPSKSPNKQNANSSIIIRTNAKLITTK
ncbi:MAG: hypothetical protein IKJ02_03950 [Tidjanibacter sp.]|nr:hypothetical protein [Tidjanibacter sp.]